MGATEFTTIGHGSTVSKAFKNAVEDALYDWGHGGYTGTIAEKDSFIVIEDTPEQILQEMEDRDRNKYTKLLTSKSPNARASYMAEALFEIDDERIMSKWGPAGAIYVEDDIWLFFGYAST